METSQPERARGRAREGAKKPVVKVISVGAEFWFLYPVLLGHQMA